MVDLSSLLGGEGGGGWTIASLLIFGIIIAIFLPQIASFISYGISLSINMSNTVETEMSSVANKTAPQGTVIKAGNYTAVVPGHANPVLSAMQSAIMTLLVAVVTLLSNPQYLALIIAATLIIIGIEIRGK